MDPKRLTYEDARALLHGEQLPCVFINLDALDANIDFLLAPVRGSGKTLRIASKSIRVPWVMRYIMDRARDGTDPGGVMAYTVREAAHLYDLGFDDLLVAYPSVHADDMALMAELTELGATIALMTDCEAHLDALHAAAKKRGVTVRAALEYDMAYAPASSLYFGVRRSAIRTPERIVELVRYAERLGHVRVAGIMGYEAQVAGLEDNNPFTKTLNYAKRAIRSVSIRDVAHRRASLHDVLEREGIALDFINGGGTGSVHSTSRDSAVTEVTAGSGFYCPHLFSYYRHLDLLPAAFFALQVVRRPLPRMVTCHGGGYIASGAPGLDRLPVVHLPQGARWTTREGAGEVQTPVQLPPTAPDIRLGDPIIFRHTKAGEVMEHFTEALLIRDGRIIDRQPTYRGQGKVFL